MERRPQSVVTVVNILDTIHAWRWGDNAAWDYGVMAARAFVGIFATFFACSSALFDRRSRNCADGRQGPFGRQQRL